MSSWNLFFVFMSVFLLLIMGGQLFFYRTALHWIDDSRRRQVNRWVIHSLFLLFNAPVIFILVLRPHTVSMPEWFKLGLVYPFYIWQFSFFLVFLLFVASSIIWGPFKIAGFLARKKRHRQIPADAPSPPPDPVNLSRRAFVRRGSVILVGSAFAGSALATYGRDRFVVENVSIPIAGLPPEFEGFTIGMISDIHSSVFMTPEQMRSYAGEMNALKTDIIAVTGDFVNSLVEEVYPFAEAFSTLQAPMGVYGVLGNHDYFTKKVDVVAKEVNDCGVKILRNDSVMLERNGAKLCLMGSDDLGSYKRAEVAFDQILRDVHGIVPKVLMCHRPYFFPQAAERGIDLTLSGHTHGGQIVFAKIGGEVLAPARLASPYMAGTYTFGNSRMYVNRGVGTVGIPMRLNCPPELTRITLVKA